jgi:hypothetical protein
VTWRALVAALTFAGCQHSNQGDAGANAIVHAFGSPATATTAPDARAPAAPNERDTAMKSYSTNYATPSRNSCVDAPARRFESLSRVSAIDRAPKFVVTNDSGAYVAFDYGQEYEVRSASGAVTSHGRKIARNPILMGPQSLLVDGDERDLAGKFGSATILTGGSQGDEIWALQVGSGDVSYVRQRRAEPYQTTESTKDGGAAAVWGTTPVQLEVDSARFFSADHATQTPVWSIALDGVGCGAIASDRRIAVAMHDRRFLVYDANRSEPDGVPRPLAASHLDFVSYDISIVTAGVALLSRAESQTILHVVDWQGHERWSAVVPFAVESPPIEATAERIYLVGRGFAAAEHGAILWNQLSPVQTFATALHDGTALLAMGAELRVVIRDGTIRQTLRVPEGDAIVAPPAVTADGTAWVATAKALYAAR